MVVYALRLGNPCYAGSWGPGVLKPPQCHNYGCAMRGSRADRSSIADHAFSNSLTFAG